MIGLIGAGCLAQQSIQQRQQASDEIITDADRAFKSICSLRGSGPKEQCCNDVDLDCHGCNPTLLSMGIPCEDQSIKEADEVRV